MLPENVVNLMEKQQYRIVGKHSAVKICYWTKQSLVNNRVCYKEKWYPPVESHRCMQMTPYLGCNFHCLHCWRIHSGDREGVVWKEYPPEIEMDDPSLIVEGCIEARRQLLSGFKGNEKVDRRKYEEALKPTMMTMSLTGEPTLYPDIAGLIEEAKRKGMISFLVTNGSMPRRLEELETLPFQLYVSIVAPNKELFEKLARPKIPDAWEKLNETLNLLPSLDTRKVLRLTMIRGYNMSKVDEYSELILRGKPDFVEVKAYEWVGESMRRLPREAMPDMEDIRRFSRRLESLCGYAWSGEFEPSGVVLLSSK